MNRQNWFIKSFFFKTYFITFKTFTIKLKQEVLYLLIGETNRQLIKQTDRQNWLTVFNSLFSCIITFKILSNA